MVKDLGVDSSSGDIYISNTGGKNFNISSISGDIEIDNSISKISIESISGDIDLDNKKNSEDVKITSTSGNVRVNFSKDANYAIEASTISGDLISSSSLIMDTVWEDNFLGKSNFKGKITGLTGEKASKIEIETTSGDVNLSTE